MFCRKTLGFDAYAAQERARLLGAHLREVALRCARGTMHLPALSFMTDVAQSCGRRRVVLKVLIMITEGSTCSVVRVSPWVAVASAESRSVTWQPQFKGRFSLIDDMYFVTVQCSCLEFSLHSHFRYGLSWHAVARDTRSSIEGGIANVLGYPVASV